MTTSDDRTAAAAIAAAGDDGRMSALHWRVFLLCASVAFMDGFDTQTLGPAAPAIAAALGMAVSDFGTVFSASQVGYLIGAVVFSALGDRLGRKRMLIVGTIIFSVCSLATALTGSYAMLVGIRFVAGLGLGGATPNFISLASEYSPPAQRQRIVTTLWAAVPFGGMIGSFASSLTLPLFGWRTIFYLGCVLPLLLVPVLWQAMPESRETAGLPARSDRAAGQGAVTALFAERRAWATTWLWLASWMTWTTLVVIAFWTPALLQRAGWSPSAAASALGFLNGGGVLGTVLVGAMLVRIRAHVALMGALLAAAAFIAALGTNPQAATAVIVAAALAGFFSSAAGGSLLAVSADLYPSGARATGVGWALGFGRIGAIVGPIAAGGLVAASWRPEDIYLAVAALPLLGAALVFLLARSSAFSKRP
jgi:MFS transporter, AAHS family, 4-hydroxybenzoate transporter